MATIPQLALWFAVFISRAFSLAIESENRVKSNDEGMLSDVRLIVGSDYCLFCAG